MIGQDYLAILVAKGCLVVGSSSVNQEFNQVIQSLEFGWHELRKRITEVLIFELACPALLMVGTCFYVRHVKAN